MSDITRETLDGVKKFARQFQHVIDLAENIESMDALRQLAGERHAQLQQVTADLMAERVLFDQVREAVKAAGENLAALNDEAAAARRDAAATKADARKEAAKIIEDAKAEAGRDYDATLTKARAELATLDSTIAGKRGEIARLNDQIDAKGRELSTLQGKAAEARAAIADVLKGV